MINSLLWYAVLILLLLIAGFTHAACFVSGLLTALMIFSLAIRSATRG